MHFLVFLYDINDISRQDRNASVPKIFIVLIANGVYYSTFKNCDSKYDEANETPFSYFALILFCFAYRIYLNCGGSSNGQCEPLKVNILQKFAR